MRPCRPPAREAVEGDGEYVTLLTGETLDAASVPVDATNGQDDRRLGFGAGPRMEDSLRGEVI